ncbi:MAG: hypothetical protein JNM62_07785 [Flavobacteriales bacterium]|nr:hypothetical protein [Flavobacteriales bacterium]
MMRPLLVAWLAFGSGIGFGQVIDSVHVFKKLPTAAYTSASANALAWKLHQAKAEHVTLKGAEIATVREGMAQYKPVPHRSGPIPGLQHLAIVFSRGRPTALGLTGDLDRLINFTARSEYRISSMSEHLKVRAILLELMMLH